MLKEHSGKSTLQRRYHSHRNQTTATNSHGRSLFDEFFRDTMTDSAPWENLKLAVVSTKPAGAVKVTEMSEVEVQTNPVDVSKLEGVKTLIDVTYEDIGGLKEEVKKVREMIEIPLKRPELFERLGISPPKGVLMHGPPGLVKPSLPRQWPMKLTPILLPYRAQKS